MKFQVYYFEIALLYQVISKSNPDNDIELKRLRHVRKLLFPVFEWLYHSLRLAFASIDLRMSLNVSILANSLERR